MISYKPIFIDPAFECSRSDMVDLVWKKGRLDAYFLVPDDAHRLRVSFDQTETFRVMDEMPLSTEEPHFDDEGLISDHFSYTVENTAFWNMQSEAFIACKPRMKHYRFITGRTCLDVLSDHEPLFKMVAIESP
ncbi:hypothetical protein [Rhizobium sp. Root482]|uniref:hypothetical protein n=1 Tax=Rhizobium sp. Root482 TaxID=1736543 RepID=UPI0006F9DE95|nr:hypothetical protein [Rhizobium sp. Root482]KQY19860.1 hypothetical protein ASD31_05570 [Rhizobium sp. Root482]